MIQRDTFDWNLHHLFIDSFITKILLDSTPDSLCRENYPQGSIQDVAGEAFIDSILRFSVT